MLQSGLTDLNHLIKISDLNQAIKIKNLCHFRAACDV